MEQDSAQGALQDAIRQSRALNDNERYQLLISEQERLADAGLNFREDYKWPCYGIDEVCQGGWCLPCILFPSHSEKSSLGAFVCST